MVALTEHEIRIARPIVWFAAIMFVVRWGMWGFTTNEPILVRAAIGAVAGAFVLGVLPPSIQWIANREQLSSEQIVDTKVDKPVSTPQLDLGSNEGILVPGNAPMPEMVAKCRVPDGALSILIGSNLSWNTRFPHTVLEMGGEQMLVVDKDDKRNLRVSVLRIFDDRDDIIARIDDDGFWVQNTLRKKRPDPSTLIVYDHNDLQVLKLQYLNEKVISIQGIFRHAKIRPSYLVVTPDAVIQMPNNNRIMSSCFGEMAADISLGVGGGFALGRAR